MLFACEGVEVDFLEFLFRVDFGGAVLSVGFDFLEGTGGQSIRPTLDVVFLAVYDCLEAVPAVTGVSGNVPSLSVTEGDVCLSLGDSVYPCVGGAAHVARFRGSEAELVDVSNPEGALLDGHLFVSIYGCSVGGLGLVADEHLFESFNVLCTLSGYPLASVSQFLFRVVEISQQGLCTCRVEEVERLTGIIEAREARPIISQSSVCIGCGVLVDCVAATFNVEVGLSFDFGDIGDVTEGVVRVDSSRNGLAFGGACSDGQGLAGESLGGFGAGDVEYMVTGDEDVGGVDGGYWFSLSMGGLRACWLSVSLNLM